MKISYLNILAATRPFVMTVARDTRNDATMGAYFVFIEGRIACVTASVTPLSVRAADRSILLFRTASRIPRMT